MWLKWKWGFSVLHEMWSHEAVCFGTELREHIFNRETAAPPDTLWIGLWLEPNKVWNVWSRQSHLLRSGVVEVSALVGCDSTSLRVPDITKQRHRTLFRGWSVPEIISVNRIGRFTHSMPCPCRVHVIPLPCRAVNSHMPCRAPAMLRQCRVLRESPLRSRKYPNS